MEERHHYLSLIYIIYYSNDYNVQRSLVKGRFFYWCVCGNIILLGSLCVRSMELQEITLKGVSSGDVDKVVAEITARFEQLDLSEDTPVPENQPIWEVVVQSPVVREKLLRMADLGWSLFMIQRRIHDRLAIKLSRPEVGRMMRHVLGSERYASQYGNRYLFEHLHNSKAGRSRKAKKVEATTSGEQVLPPSGVSSPAPSQPLPSSQAYDSENWFS